MISWGLRCGALGDPTVVADAARYRAFLEASAPAWAPIIREGRAVITGKPQVGQELTCSGPAFETPPEQVTYRFESYRYARGSVVRQETPEATYRVRHADRRRLVLCTVVGHTSGGSAASATSAGVRVG